MKKFLSLMLSVVLALCFCQPAFADSNFTDVADSRYYSSILRVSDLGIMTGNGDGTFGAKSELKRAELAQVILRLLKLESLAISSASANQYLDVPEEHYAYSAINAATAMQILNGVGDGRFDPDGTLTVEQAVKVIVCILGYGSILDTEASESWFQPYILQAGKINLLNGLSTETGTPATREWFARLIDNALDQKVLELSYEYSADGGERYVLKETLIDKFLSDGAELHGILEADHRTSITGTYSVEDDQVIIGGYSYYLDEGLDVSALIGQSVRFYAIDDDGMAYIKGISPRPRMNETVALSGVDVASVQGRTVNYYLDDEDEKLTLDDNLKIVYNNRYHSTYSADLLTARSAKLRFLDNNGDETYDVVFIECYELGTILKVNAADETVQFKNMLADGTLLLDYSKDKNRFVSFADKNGGEIAPETFQKEDLTEVHRSKDGNYTRLVRLDEKVTGMVTQIDASEGTVWVDGEVYDLAQGEYTYRVTPESLSIGKTYDFTMDSKNEIVYAEESLDSAGSQLAYIYQMQMPDSGIKKQLEIQLIKGTRVKSVLEGVSTYYMQAVEAQTLETLKIADKVVINGTSYTEPVRIYDVLSAEPKLGRNHLIRYALNAAGEIKRIDIVTEKRGDYTAKQTLNTKSLVVTGSEEPFGIGEDTVVFFIPASGDEEDIYTQMKFGKNEYYMQGFEYDAEDLTVSAMVFKNENRINDDSPISSDVKMKVVQNVTTTLVNDEEAYRISGYDNGTAFDLKTKPGLSLDGADRIKPGDIVQYLVDFNGNINKISRISSLPMDNNFYITGADTDEEMCYGMAYEANSKFLGAASDDYEQQLVIALDENNEDLYYYQLSTDDNDKPCIYTYDIQRAVYTPSTFEDILSISRVGRKDASKVFVYAPGKEVKVVVIVK